MKRLMMAAFVTAGMALAAPASAQTRIAADTPVQGRLERGDTIRNGDWVDSYSYNGEAGEEVRVYRGRPGGDGYDGYMQVRGPGGFATELLGGEAANVRLPQRGRYTISVLNPSAYAPMDYVLTVFRVSTDQPPTQLQAGQTIRAGFTRTDNLRPNMSHMRQDAYTYTAQADEAAEFHIEGQRTALFLDISGPGNFSHSRYFDSGAGGSVSVYFPTAGEYRVLLSGEGGSYALTVRPRLRAVDAAPVGHMVVGDTVELTYAADGPIDSSQNTVSIYTVDAQRGDRLAIIRPVRWGANVRGPNGQPIQATWSTDDETQVSRVEFTATVTGQYRIEAPVYSNLTPEQSTMQLVSAAQGASLMAEARARGERQLAERNARVAQLLQQGDQALNSGNNEAATAAYTEARTLDPYNVPAMINLGVASFREGRFFAAAGWFEMALIYDPNNQLAAANLAAALQADETQQREQQQLYAQQQQAYAQQQREREQEDAQMLSNALSAFAAGVDVGNSINAANAPPQQMPTTTTPGASQPSPERASAPQTPCVPAGTVAYYGGRYCDGPSTASGGGGAERVNCVTLQHGWRSPQNEYTTEWVYANQCPFTATLFVSGGASDGWNIPAGRFVRAPNPNASYYATRCTNC